MSDTEHPDLLQLFRGGLGTKTATEATAISVLTGREHTVSLDEIKALYTIPSSKWTTLEDAVGVLGLEDHTLESLVGKELLVTDGQTVREIEIRKRDERFAELGWFPFAALYHQTSKWDDIDLFRDAGTTKRELGNAVAERLTAQLQSTSPPPPHFYLRNTERVLDLPHPQTAGRLYEVLVRRHTTRLFNRDSNLSRENLSSLLFYTYGCHGLHRFTDELAVIKRTSPSGGSMHPIEVYPLILRVEGLDAGLYHYDIANHALESMKPLSIGTAEQWANELMAGQPYAADAGALFILTARFRRSFWKYPDHHKAYRVVLMDIGHLSQTFYLVCTELSLGAFFSTAISEIKIEERLQLDGVEEGALAISGCGVIGSPSDVQHFRHGPYPRTQT